jgi:CRP-like cAMP-binding protein
MVAVEIVQSLEEADFFKGLDPHQIQRVAAICELRDCYAGEFVYQQGDSSGLLFIIVEGQVVLERFTHVGARRGTVAVGILGRGQLFGGWSTLLGEPHRLMLSAICRKPSRLVMFKGAELREMMTGDMRLGFDILERLCFLLRERVQFALGAMENI